MVIEDDCLCLQGSQIQLLIYCYLIREKQQMNPHDQTNMYFNNQNMYGQPGIDTMPATNHYLNNPMDPNNPMMANPNMMANNMMGNPNMMGMGGMFGAMPMMNFANDPRRFSYAGDQMTYRVRLEALNEQQLQSISEVFLYVTGRQANQGSPLCLVCTIIWGSFLILPLFLMCFDFWKACVYPCFDLSVQFYTSIARLSQRNLQSLTIIVKDNAFNNQKAQILYQAVSSQPNLIGFTFINVASGFNYNANEYSNFEDNMKPFKKLPIMTDIRWFREVVKA